MPGKLKGSAGIREPGCLDTSTIVQPCQKQCKADHHIMACDSLQGNSSPSAPHAWDLLRIWDWTHQSLTSAAHMHRLPPWHVPPRRQQSPHLLHAWVSVLPTGVPALPQVSGDSSSGVASSSRFRLSDSCTDTVLRLPPGNRLWLRCGNSPSAADGPLLSLLCLTRLLVEAGRLDGCGNGQRGLGANRQVFCHLQDLGICPSLQALPPLCISNV